MNAMNSIEYEHVNIGCSEHTRNYGIDLFRLFAMWLIIILHILGQGGIIAETSNQLNRSYLVVMLLETVAFCSVNCYALISGFVGYKEQEKEYKYGKYLSFWLQAVFYGLLGRIITHLCFNSAPRFDFSSAFFPVLTNEWWYFTAYTALFFLIPFYNLLIRSLSLKQITFLIGCLLFFFSCLETISRTNIFDVDKGYSFLWLSVLYFVGAWLKKYKIQKKRFPKRWKSFLLFISILAIALTWVAGLKLNYSDLMQYTSPTMVLLAVFFLVTFSELEFNATICNIISFFASGTLGVYLLHVEPHFWDIVMKNRFVFIGKFPTLAIPIVVFVFALAILVVGCVIDKLRRMLFSLLHVDSFCLNLDRRIANTFKKIC